MSWDARTGVLLLNMGGPETLAEVRPFLFRLFRDPDILPLPRWLRWLAWPIALLISTFRAPKSRHAYATIGGGSPQRRTNEAVATKLAAHLGGSDGAAPIAVAMRYWRPFTDTALDTLQRAGVERIVAVPMYPQYSTTTTMSSYRELRRRLRRRAWQPRLLPILDFHADEGYVGLIEKRLRATMAALPADAGPLAVLFSAHSIPVDRVRQLQDPYPRDVAAMVARLSTALPAGVRAVTAFQSRVGPVAWLGPQFDDTLRQLARDGVRAVVVVPLSFVSEHVETLEEIDRTYAELARSLGIHTFVRVPTVRDDDDFVSFLGTLVRQRLAGQSVPPQCRRGATRCVCIGTDAAP